MAVWRQQYPGSKLFPCCYAAVVPKGAMHGSVRKGMHASGMSCCRLDRFLRYEAAPHTTRELCTCMHTNAFKLLAPTAPTVATSPRLHSLAHV